MQATASEECIFAANNVAEMPYQGEPVRHRGAIVVVLTKRILFVVLNTFSIALLAFISGLYLSLRQGEDPLALVFTYFAGMAFLLIGLLLLLLARYLRVSSLALVLPFAALAYTDPRVGPGSQHAANRFRPLGCGLHQHLALPDDCI